VSANLRDQLQATLGNAYSLEQELGGGGMSRVFVAVETALGRKVVVKVLAPELAVDVNTERFRREIQLAAQLQQANIVPVHTAGELGGLPYYTMPLVDGYSLRSRLAQGVPLSITEIVSVLRDVAKALAYAHERGVVHRDIKPDNVLLSGGTAVVTDFGVAKALSAAKRDGTRGATLTEVGTSLGTPAYMAPEQAAADPSADHRADIYAFGILAYELLAGQPPFHGRSPHKLLAAQMGETPEPISSLRPDTPPLLAELVTKCLEKEPDKRPQSATDLVRVLETVTSGGGLPAMPAILLGGRRRLGRALLWYALSFIAVALIARAAIIAIGLPDWVFPGALVVMALGLPVILFTGFVHRGTHQALTAAALTPGGTPTQHSTLTRLAVKASPWVSWRRTALGGVAALTAFVLLVVGFMILRALGIGPAGSLLASGKLADRDRLMVTDFNVRGADTTVASVIGEAVRTDLAQSSVVSVMSPAAIGDALARMEKPPTTRVDLPLARQIAAREGVKAIVDGDVAPLGAGYVMAVRLVAADSGAELAAFRATAGSPQDLLPTLDKLTKQLRGKIGESLRTVQASPPLEQVTTTSLEALKKYAAGARANDIETNGPKAITLLSEAVALDTTFAMAYRKLGVAYWNSDMNVQADSALSRAYRHRERLPDRERYLTTASYFDNGPGQARSQAAAAYEAVLEHDSLDMVAGNNLAVILFNRRQFDRAKAVYNRAVRAGNGSFYEYQGVFWSQLAMGNAAGAESAYAAMRTKFPDNNSLPIATATLYYGRGQIDSAATQTTRVRTSASNPFIRGYATYRLSDLMYVRGRLAEGQRLYADALAQDSARGGSPTPLGLQLDSALLDIWYRDQSARGVAILDAALVRSPLKSFDLRQRPYMDVARAYAMGGRPDRARAVLAQYAADVKDTTWQRVSSPWQHAVLANIALAEHRPLDAVGEFRKADSLPDGPADPCAACLHFYLGRAFDLASIPDSAIAEYELYLTTPRILGPWPLIDAQGLAGVHKRLGELYEAKGDRAKAVSHYLQFVELWKNADPELQPKVGEVRARLARLKDTEAR